MASKPLVGGRRPGGRSTRVVAAVMASTLETLGRVGFARLRVEDVAARSGVNKTTIYRRWPEKLDLVRAAVLRSAARRMKWTPATCGGTSSRASAARCAGGRPARAAGPCASSPPNGRSRRSTHSRGSIGERYRTPRRRILERAIARGQMPADVDIELLLDIMTSTVLTRVRCAPGPGHAGWLPRVVDLALAGRRAMSAVPNGRRPLASTEDGMDTWFMNGDGKLPRPSRARPA